MLARPLSARQEKQGFNRRSEFVLQAKLVRFKKNISMLKYGKSIKFGTYFVEDPKNNQSNQILNLLKF